MYARCGTPHCLGLTMTSLNQYNAVISTLSIRIYRTPMHFLSLLCVSCPNAEMTCAELSSKVCYPHRTDYTTSCLCRVIHSPYDLRNRALFQRIRARCDRFRKTLVAYGLQHGQ